MNLWDCDIEFNDTAIDFKEDCVSLMEESGCSLYEATDMLLRVVDRYKGVDGVLMAGKMEFEEYGEVKHINEVKRTLHLAMSIEELGKWDLPRKRLDSLTEFKKYINI